MSFTALNSALSGLRIAQQQLNVISTNVSNATTPGYTRKTLPQSTQVINSTGQIIGVRSDPIIRNVDLNLERELWTQISEVSYTDVTGAYLNTIEKFHGSTHKEFSIAAQIAALKDKFAALSDSPSDGFLLQSTLAQAENVAKKFNDFGKLLTELRNDAQEEMSQTVNRINDLLQTISSLNGDIKGSANVGRSTAGLEDHRDEAVKELSQYLEVTFFRRGDGVMVVQSATGVQLADERVSPLFFDPGAIGPTTTYPGSVAGIWTGNPNTSPTAFDLTTTGLGGKLGALIDLRDNTLVQYQAQIDELAHKTALRLEAQGLRLFTDVSGSVPSDAPPDLSTNPPGTVSYVGFASSIQVNKDIVNNISLLQKGTYTSDRAIPTASNEIIRRVIQFGFGDINYQQAAGTIDLNSTGGEDLQTWLGLPSRNNVVGGINFSQFPRLGITTDVGDVPVSTDLQFILQDFFQSPANDQFQITFSDPRLGVPDATITIDLSDAADAHRIGDPGINDALDQLIAHVNDQIAALPPSAAAFGAVATRNTNGQLVINSRANTTFNASGFPNAMGTEALRSLGFQEKSFAVEDPYFDVQVGSNELVRITIAPGDTPADLVNKLQYNPITGKGVPGLHVNFDAATGQLTLRPGMDDTNGGPDFGGDIKIISGPGTTTGAINPVLAGLPAGATVVGALFGSFTVNGANVVETSPVANVYYGSETFAGSGVFVGFRSQYLGPEASTKTNLTARTNIIDFGQKIVNAHGQDVVLNESKKQDKTALRDLLSERFLNESGVNIDEELSHLIIIQTAYAAAARAVTAADEMFTELLNAI